MRNRSSQSEKRAKRNSREFPVVRSDNASKSLHTLDFDLFCRKEIKCRLSLMMLDKRRFNAPTSVDDGKPSPCDIHSKGIQFPMPSYKFPYKRSLHHNSIYDNFNYKYHCGKKSQSLLKAPVKRGIPIQNHCMGQRGKPKTVMNELICYMEAPSWCAVEIIC